MPRCSTPRPTLRIVANIAVGYNNIDVAACRARGVIVTNTPDVLTNACADFTWALILAITRRLGEAERQLRRGDWKGWALDHMLGMELRGKRLGLVGLGRIGRAVAEQGAAFRHVGRLHDAAAGGPARCRGAVVRSAAGDLRCRVAPLSADARDDDT